LKLLVGVDVSSEVVDLESLEYCRSEFGPRRHDGDDLEVPFIGRDDFLANERAAGGSRDTAALLVAPGKRPTNARSTSMRKRIPRFIPQIDLT
jgi:hypothetical protein